MVSQPCKTQLVYMAKRLDYIKRVGNQNELSEEARLVSHRFLAIANQHTELDSLLQAFISELQELSRCSAVGIRILDEDGNIPYEAQIGFSQEFYELESPLSIKSDECMCINVVKGSADPNLSYYTKYGSFYTNSTTHLLATVSEEEKGKTRNACNIFGYESVLLIPIRDEDRILGLIHLADPKENMIPTVIVEVLEAVAAQSGASIRRLRGEEELHKEFQEASERQQEVLALLESAKAVLTYQDFEKAAETIFDHCKNLIGATLGYVALKSSDSSQSKAIVLDIGGISCNVDPSLPTPLRGLCAESFHSGKPVLDNDFAKSEWMGLLPEGHMTLDNILFAPLLFEGKSVGLLSVANKPGGFTSDDISVATAFAEILAIALHHGQITESLKEREEQFRSVTQSVTDGIVTADSRGNIAHWNRAAEKIFGYSAEETIGKPLTMLMPKRLSLAHKSSFILAGSTGKSSKIGKTLELTGVRNDQSEFPLELSITTWRHKGRVFFTGTLRDITDSKRAEERIKNLAKFPSENPYPVLRVDRDGTVLFANAASLPLLGAWQAELGQLAPTYWRRIVNNVLDSDRIEKNIEVELEERTLSFTATPVPEADYVNLYGLDITERKKAEEEKAKLFHALGERVKELNCLYAIAKIAAAPDVSLGELCQETVEIIPPSWQYPEITCARILIHDQVYKTTNFKKTQWVQTADIREHGNKVGTVEVYYLEERPLMHEGPFLKEEGDLIGGIAERLGGVGERWEARRLSEARNAINSAVSSTLDFDEIMRQVVRKTQEALGCENCSVLLEEDGEWVLRYSHGQPYAKVGSRFPINPSIVTALDGRRKKSLLINDPLNDKRSNRQLVKKLGIQSYLVVALSSHDEVIGVLACSNYSASRGFNKPQVDFTEKLAALVSLAIENARLYEAQSKIAGNLQEAVLTMPQGLTGIEFGHVYRSAKLDSAQVGGDFYDLFELEDHKVGILIGDVSGKGIEAARSTSMIKNTIKAYSFQGASPARVLSMTNQVLCKTSRAAEFVTVFLGILDSSSGFLSYCCAGHPPPLLLKRKDFHVSLLAAVSPAVGILPELDYCGGEETLEPGDILIAYTDGITEARHGPDFFGEGRLVSFIEELKPKTASQLPQILINQVSDFADGKLVDDIAILSVSLKGNVN